MWLECAGQYVIRSRGLRGEFIELRRDSGRDAAAKNGYYGQLLLQRPLVYVAISLSTIFTLLQRMNEIMDMNGRVTFALNLAIHNARLLA